VNGSVCARAEGRLTELQVLDRASHGGLEYSVALGRGE
jgi:hypothetical protein